MKILLGSTSSKRKVRVTITTTKRSVQGEPVPVTDGDEPEAYPPTSRDPLNLTGKPASISSTEGSLKLLAQNET